MRFGVIWTIVRKELTETLRDRRTLLMMVVLPVLLYPVIMMGFSRLQESQQAATEDRNSVIAVWGPAPDGLAEALTRSGKTTLGLWRGAPAVVRRAFEDGTASRPAVLRRDPRAAPAGAAASRRTATSDPVEPNNPVQAAARAAIADKTVDVVLVLWPDVGPALAASRAGSVSVYFDSVREDSLQARERVSDALTEYRDALVHGREQERGLAQGFSLGLDVRATNVATESRRTGQILALFLPFLLVVMSLLGGFYPAIDMTAGEKERGTMQTLLCAPVRPVEIITGKFLAVWIISLIAALANVVSLGATVIRIIPGEQISVSPSTYALMFLMLLPLTFFMTAVFLSVAAFACDFKDGQNFLTPVYMVLALPAGVTMLRGIELNAWTAFVPVVNIALLIKAQLMAEASGELVFLALVSSTAYATLAVLLAARVFEREQLLLGGRESVRGLFGLTPGARRVPSPSLAMTAFAVVLVVTFYGSLLLRDSGTVGLLLVTEYGFFLLPTIALVAAFRFPVRRTLALRRPPLLGVVAAALIGLSAWTFAGGVLIRLLPPPESLVKALEQLLLLDGKPVALWIVWLVVAVTPALCEELFFRGLVLSGLRTLGTWPALLVCALLFGVAHASIYRLLPTAFLGLLLSWLVWRTGSIFTAVIAHALNNGLAATLVYSKTLVDALGLTNSVYLDWRITVAGSMVMVTGLAVLRALPPTAHET